jgi:rubrerythrin
MTEKPHGEAQENPNTGAADAVGETDTINWACTNCGYHIEGELPEKCPDCGAPREDFESVPIPGF